MAAIKRRRWWRYILLSLGIIIILLTGITLYVQSRSFSFWLLHRLNRALQHQWPVGIEAKSLKINLWRARVEAAGLRLIPIVGKLEPTDKVLPPPPLFSVEKMVVNFSVLPFFHRELQVEEVEIKFPSINFTQVSQVQRIAAATSAKGKPAQKPKPWRFRIAHFHLEGGSVEWSKPGFLSSLSLENIEAEIRFNEAKKEHEGQLTSSGGKIAFSGYSALAISSWHSVFRFNDERFSLERFVIKTEASSLEGWMNGRFSPYFFLSKLQAKGEVSLDKLPFVKTFDKRKLAPLSPLASATVAATTSSSLSLSSFSSSPNSSSTTTSCSDLFASPSLFSQGQLQFSLNLEGQEPSDSEKAAVLSGGLEINGQNLVVAHLALAPLSGRVDFQLPIIGLKGDLNQLEANFRLELQPKLEAPSHPAEAKTSSRLAQPLKGELAGCLKGKVLDLNVFRWELAGINFAGAGRFDAGRNLEAKFSLAVANLGKSLEELARWGWFSSKILDIVSAGQIRPQELTRRKKEGQVFPAEDEGRGGYGAREKASTWPPLSGQVSLEAEVSGYWPKLSGQVKLRAQNLTGPIFREGELEARAEIKNQQISLSRLAFHSPAIEASLTGYFSFDPSHQDFGRRAEIELGIDIARLPRLIEGLLHFLAAEEWPLIKDSRFQISGGRLSLEAKIKGGVAAPQSLFRVEGKEIKVGQEALAGLEIEGQADRKRLEVSRLVLKKTALSSAFTGRLIYDFNQKKFDGSISAIRQNLEDFSWLPTSLSLRGLLGFDLEVKGDAKNIDLIYKIEGDNINSAFFSLPAIRVSGEAKISNARPKTVNLMVDFRPAGFKIGSVEVETLEPLQLILRNDVLSVSGLNWRSQDFLFRVQGGIGLKETTSELSLEANFPLSLMARLLNQRRGQNFSGQGELIVAGRVAGNLRNLKPEITATITGGSFASPFVAVPAEKIDLRARLNQEALELEKLSLTLGQGRVFIQAKIPFFKFVSSTALSAGLDSRESTYFAPIKRLKADRNSLIFNEKQGLSLQPAKKEPGTERQDEGKRRERAGGRAGLGGIKELATKSRSDSQKGIDGQPKLEDADDEQWPKGGQTSPEAKIEYKFASKSQPAEKATIKVSFSQLDPANFLGHLLTKLPAEFKAKAEPNRFSGEVSGEINLSFLPDPMKNWRSSLQAEGTLTALRVNLEPFSLANEEPVILRLEPDLLTLEKVDLRSEFFRLAIGGKILNPLAQKALSKPRADLSLQAEGDLAGLASFFPGLDFRGGVYLSLHLTGSGSALEPQGSLELRRVSIETTSFPLRLSDTTGFLFFSGRRLEIRSCRGLINSAPWEISGSLLVDEKRRQLQSGSLQILAQNIPLELEGTMGTRTDLSLQLASKEGTWTLSGNIALKDTAITADISSFSQLMGRRPYRPPRHGQSQLPAAFQDIALNIRLNLETPVAISNSFLRARIQGSLSLAGTLSQPVLLGRLTNPGPGEFIWAQRRYRLEKMQVDFTGVFPPDPHVEIQAKTELVHRYDELAVQLSLSGPVSELRLNFQSSPPRSQEELAFLLLTGKSIEEIRGQGLKAFREQVLLALATPAASQLGGLMRRLFGVEEVRLEPLSIAGETDPGARLTLVKQITPAARVTTSMDISNSQRQTWLLDYRLLRGLMFQGFRKDDGSYGAGLRHSFSLAGGGKQREGGVRPEGVAKRLRITGLEIKGEAAFPESLLKKRLAGLRPGKAFSSSLLEASIKELEAFYRKNKYLRARITPQVRVEGEKGVEVVLEVEAGPQIELDYGRAGLSRSWRRQVEALWAKGVNPEAAAKESARLMEKLLKGKGYYQAKISFELKQESRAEEKGEARAAAAKEKQDRAKKIIGAFRIEAGSRYRIERVKIDGAEEGRGEELRRQISSWRTAEAKGYWLLVVEPKAVAEAIQSWYEAKGFLAAKAAVAGVEVDAARRALAIRVVVEEGPLSRVAETKIEGNQVLAAAELQPFLRLRPGAAFNPDLVLADRNRLLSFYRSQGFREAAVSPKVEVKDEGPDVTIIFQVAEGVRHEVDSVEFSGVEERQKKTLSSIFGLKPGETLSYEKISQGQKALYETGDFSLVEVMSEPIAGVTGKEKVRVDLRREPVANFRYGLRYNSEEKTEFTAGVDFRHLFGLGRHGLLNYLQSAQRQDFRFSFHDRHFLGSAVESLLSFYLTRKKEASFTVDETGASWQQRLTLPGRIQLSTVLRRSRIHTYETVATGPFLFDISLSLTELSLQAVRDTRDDPLDARRGAFFSSSLTYSPEALKSELTYLSWFGQASFYQSFGERLVFASNFRLGLATAFDQVMVPARRFYAGGSYSLRGFKQDMVGPYDPYLDAPEGGEAVFISNQELRFPLWWGLDGVVFYDAGNVFPEVKNLSFRDLRPSLGVGLRLRSPVGLLRFDLGFNLKPKQGEAKQVFYFSLGQVF
jgi:outer membrane protein assembly complex protein YaeT